MDVMLSVNEEYGNLIWYVARRYSLLGLEPLDVYHDVLLSCVAAVSSKNLSTYTELADQDRMRSVIISAAIDSCRRELKHQKKRSRARSGLLEAAERIKWDTQDDAEFREQIVALLPLLDANIICEFLWPADATRDLAITEAEQVAIEAVCDVGVRMNWRDVPNAKVMKKHVAKALGISPARVSNAFTCARENIGKLI